MTERNDGRGPSEAADKNAPAMSFAESSAKILSRQTAAFAMMTAYGVSLTSRMTGMFFGAMADAMEKASPKTPASHSDEMNVQPEPHTKVEPQAATKTKPVAMARPAKPAQNGVAKPSSGSKARTKAVPGSRSRIVNRQTVRGEKVKTRSHGDNLKLIPGIGPKLEQALNGMGVIRLSQIADWKPADIKKIDDDLGLENRIIRDDWAGQARRILREGK